MATGGNQLRKLIFMPCLRIKILEIPLTIFIWSTISGLLLLSSMFVLDKYKEQKVGWHVGPTGPGRLC